MDTSGIRILWLDTEDLYTTRRAVQVGKTLGIRVDCVDVSDLTFIAGDKNVGIYHDDDDISQCYDAVIIRTFMPYICEVLTIAKVFRNAGKVVVDTCLTDEGYVISKMHDYLMLSNHGIPVPRTFQCFDFKSIERTAISLGFPCILKGIHGSEGRHVYKFDHLEQLLRKARRYKAGELQLQEYLDAEVDYRVMVIGYKALSTFVQRKPRLGDFRTNFEFNEEVTALSLSDFPEIRTIAENAAIALRREFSGVDIRFRGKQPLILEANRRPGFKDFEHVTGVDVAGKFIQYVAKRCASELDITTRTKATQ